MKVTPIITLEVWETRSYHPVGPTKNHNTKFQNPSLTPKKLERKNDLTDLQILISFNI